MLAVAEATRDAARLTPQVRAVMERAAREALMPRLGRIAAADITEKARDEIVTVADFASETILAEGLAELLPGAAIVGEEAAAADEGVLAGLGAPSCWIVDPLDGTANFARGEGPFGIMVALAASGVPIGGWILDPVRQRFSAAIKGRGATIGTEVVGRRASRERPRLGISALLKKDHVAHAAIVEALGEDFDLVDLPRCAAEVYPSICLGELDGALFQRTLAWDHAPGVLLIQESGGSCARFDGSDYRTDDSRAGLIAGATRELTATISERLQSLAAL